jgi:hypothetical protein
MIRVYASVLAAIGLAAPYSLSSQSIFSQAGPSPFAAAYRADLAVPDAPAFSLLQVDPSTILRPNTVQDLALAFSQFRGEDGGIDVPRAFALEFSPALLIAGPDLSRASYRKKRLLYNLRLSAAALNDSTAAAVDAVAFGARITLANEADLRLDDSFTQDQQVTPLTTAMVNVYQAARDRQVDAGLPIDAPIVLNTEEQREIERLSDEIRKRWADRYWNARALEVALGARASTRDGGGASPRIAEVGLWGTYATGFGDWGQLLIGARAGADRAPDEASFRQSASAATRLYLGTNSYKAFIELEQLVREGSTAAPFVNSGAEIRLAEWIWASLSLGLRGGDSGSETVTSFRLKSAFPR